VALLCRSQCQSSDSVQVAVVVSAKGQCIAGIVQVAVLAKGQCTDGSVQVAVAASAKGVPWIACGAGRAAGHTQIPTPPVPQNSPWGI
jgi:hypothetical protein